MLDTVKAKPRDYEIIATPFAKHWRLIHSHFVDLNGRISRRSSHLTLPRPIPKARRWEHFTMRGEGGSVATPASAHRPRPYQLVDMLADDCTAKPPPDTSKFLPAASWRSPRDRRHPCRTTPNSPQPSPPAAVSLGFTHLEPDEDRPNGRYLARSFAACGISAPCLPMLLVALDADLYLAPRLSAETPHPPNAARIWTRIGRSLAPPKPEGESDI